MPSVNAWVKRPTGLIRRRAEAQALLRKSTLIKVENVSQERIYGINQNHSA